jgi:hypothetical protein
LSYRRPTSDPASATCSPTTAPVSHSHRASAARPPRWRRRRGRPTKGCTELSMHAAQRTVHPHAGCSIVSVRESTRVSKTAGNRLFGERLKKRTCAHRSKNGFRSVYWSVFGNVAVFWSLASTFLEAIDHFLISMNSNQSALSIFELVDRRMAQGVQNRRRWMKMSKGMDARAAGGERLCF